MNTAGRTTRWLAPAFRRVGWFIPPFISMGALQQAANLIERSPDPPTLREIEECVSDFYDPMGLAAMVLQRYPLVASVGGYVEIVKEATEAHFLGLHRVAASGLVPVVEGVGREIAREYGLSPNLPVQQLFRSLASSFKERVASLNFGAVDECMDMLSAFEAFVCDNLYANTNLIEVGDGTNRHGITHGVYKDIDFGRRINFYKLVSTMDFFAWVDMLHHPGSVFAPAPDMASLRLASHYVQLSRVRRPR